MRVLCVLRMQRGKKSTDGRRTTPRAGQTATVRPARPSHPPRRSVRPAANESTPRSSRSTSRLAQAIAAGELYVVFQPVVDLSTGKPFAYEALVRSHAPDFPNPGAILAAAVEARMCGKLGRVLRQMAIAVCPNQPLFLNVHPNELDEAWLVRPDDPIYVHDQPIYLEITESVPITHFRFCHGMLNEVRGRGVRLVVDDLGAGYSNLKYIVDLEPQIVKLDRELVAGLRRGTRLFRLVKSLVLLCNDLGAKVVCEGIETAVELDSVIASGAQYGQGFYMARPAFPLPPYNWRELMQPLASL